VMFRRGDGPIESDRFCWAAQRLAEVREGICL
jgi:hypothetical protein